MVRPWVSDLTPRTFLRNGKLQSQVSENEHDGSHSQHVKYQCFYPQNNKV